ncbi:MAG: hypothetical protein LBT01_07320 [Spirochaetaceae bacterium]|jgi:hypothetical protein|nr:hypothetical protein [Spirochaetaceae bacterium]
MIPCYEFDLSITLYEFLIGLSAFIGALAIVAGGIRWLANKLNKNTTTIKSILPYIRIDEAKTYLPVKSQHEFSQIIRDAPLDVLQVASLAYFVHFNSTDKNENKVVYKSNCKPRFGIKWLFEAAKGSAVDDIRKKIKRAKSYLFNVKRYEDYIFKNTNVNETMDTIRHLECEIPLDPIRFLPFYKTVSISVKIENSNKSHTSWCKFKLNIEDNAIQSMANKIPELNSKKEREYWLKNWKKEFDKNNEPKFDLSSEGGSSIYGKS